MLKFSFVFPAVLLLGAFTNPGLAFVPPKSTFIARQDSQLKMAEDETLDPARTALLLIEYQNEFASEGGKLHDAVKESMEKTNMLENSKKLVESAREAGCTIMHVPIQFEKGHKEISRTPYGVLAGVKEGEAFTAGEWGADFCPEMRPADGDVVVKGKTGLCGFETTNLNFLLQSNDIKNVVIGGFLTNCCVESSMRAAYEKGYKVYTLKDGCAATSVAAHENAIENDFGLFSIPTTTENVINSLKK